MSFATDLNKKLKNIDSEIDNIQGELSEKKTGLSNINKQILNLNSEIGKKEAIIVEVQTNLKDTKKKIKDNNKEIKNIQKNIEINKEKLGKRVKAMSKVNEMYYVRILLGSEDIKDFISTVNTMKKISNQDKKDIDNLKIQKNKLSKKLKEFSELEKNLSGLEKEYKLQNQALIAKKEEQSMNMKALESDIKSLEELENLKIAESKALNEQIKQMAINNGYSGSYSGVMAWPTSPRGEVTSPYGTRIHPILKKPMFHSGVDIGVGMGSPVLSASDGKVIFSGEKGTYGRTVIIDHGSSITTLYAHCSALYVNEGQNVKRGEKIAAVGSTGRSTGPHLHFEVRKNGITTNPLDYI